MLSLWIVPETSGGIRAYSEVLASALGKTARALWRLPEPTELRESAVDVVHVQHEFGLFGSKLPGMYRFPNWFAEARKLTPKSKWVATAHTVIDADWRYRASGRGWRSVLFVILNLFLPFLRTAWMERTWGGFDGVIVHSDRQRTAIRESGCPKVGVIPHYVPKGRIQSIDEPGSPSVLLFGYFSPEKGQDIAIRAWAAMGGEAPRLILAGGVRRKEDRSYYERCLAAIRRCGLEDKIEVTGFVPESELSGYFSNSTLVLAPFRETSGSGSLATALGHGAAILASDLPLNREIDARVAGCLGFFRAGSPDSLAEEIRNLLGDRARRDSLRAGALRYADAFSIDKIAEMHRAFYREVLGQGEA